MLDSVMKNFIVVPESLAADEAGKSIDRPSFAYRQVLEYVLKVAGSNDLVYLAPANTFGGSVTEEQAAYKYLIHHQARFKVMCPGINLPPISDRPSYVDTWNNAILLRGVINSPGMEYELVTTWLHARRARWCFTRAGFDLTRVHAIRIAIESERIVLRTFYYRYLPLYYLYEALAYARDRLKYGGR